MSKFFIFIFIISFSLQSDDFHYIHSFYGPRASGMAGAYTAISDDSSGTYYNPAGLAFSYDDSITINATSYQTIRKNYHNIFGPWQDYNQKSQKYLPDFVGTVKSFDKLRVGFSIVNGIHDSYDQDNTIYLPSNSSIATLDIGFSQEKFNLMMGPSVSYPISDRFSVGMTLYYTYDTSRTSSKRLAEGFKNEVATFELEERRETRGFNPIIGFQYLLTEKLVLGLTYRKNFNIGGSISLKESLLETSPLLSTFDPMLTSVDNGYLIVEQRNEKVSTIVADNHLVIGTPITHKLPEVNKFNFGIAYFLNKRFVTSFDLMYATPYKYYLPQVEYNPYTFQTSFSSSLKNDLERRATYNYALGFEYYITETFLIRLGYYTNRSNGKIASWAETAVELALNEQLGGKFIIPINEKLEYI
ncbi:MAG: outer membrane protein transport protein [Leptospiraceae bacterium]|nr:outer membrane protein transport protein [Leptospiraceae bacterium]